MNGICKAWQCSLAIDMPTKGRQRGAEAPRKGKKDVFRHRRPAPKRAKEPTEEQEEEPKIQRCEQDLAETFQPLMFYKAADQLEKYYQEFNDMNKDEKTTSTDRNFMDLFMMSHVR